MTTLISDNGPSLAAGVEEESRPARRMFLAGVPRASLQQGGFLIFGGTLAALLSQQAQR